jgi:beta-phosphoglucomutase family hydrolase
MDGVLTSTAALHAEAWKTMFDEFLAQRGQPPFDAHDDYDAYVDGRPRYEGVRAFLAARGIELPAGDPADPPSAQTIYGLGNRKNLLVQQVIARRGVHAYEGSLRFLEVVRADGAKTAVVTSSENASAVLRAAGLSGFDAQVDGLVAHERRLAGKPAPDFFLEAARRVGVAPGAAAVFEDALAGVQAGRAGGFGTVVGVDRVGQAEALGEHGADLVVRDLAELLTA